MAKPSVVHYILMGWFELIWFKQTQIEENKRIKPYLTLKHTQSDGDSISKYKPIKFSYLSSPVYKREQRNKEQSTPIALQSGVKQHGLIISFNSE